MVPPGDDEHDCDWKSYAQHLQEQLGKVLEAQQKQQAELDALKRQLIGKKSEKMPAMSREARRDQQPDPETKQRTRRANAELRAKKIETETVHVPVPETDKRCPKCGGHDFSSLGDGKPSSVLDYVPGYFRRRVFRRETVTCKCGGHVVTAPVPDKVFEKTQYGPRFMAFLVVSKCCDAIPLYRLEKQFGRFGIPMSRSTMTHLFQRVGFSLRIIARRILQMIAASDIVLADETSKRMQTSEKRAFIWTFIAGNMVAYRFSPIAAGKPLATFLGAPVARSSSTCIPVTTR